MKIIKILKFCDKPKLHIYQKLYRLHNLRFNNNIRLYKHHF